MLWLERTGIRRADFLNAPSVFAARAITQLFHLEGKPCPILHYMSSIPKASVKVRDRWRVMYTGTLTQRKGVIQLIQSWPDVQRECPDAELHLYGKDTAHPPAASMREYLEQLLPVNCRRQVIFHGHVPPPIIDIAIAAARVSVFPSMAETFGLAPVEAMATGCPTIFGKGCAGSEIIEDGRSGLLIDPLKPNEISAAILRFLKDDALADSCGLAGWRRARDLFSIDALVPRFEAYYAECMSDFNSCRRSPSKWRAQFFPLSTPRMLF
jgi:glycosyltransferase involved in cell wall biosynthesis